jgi:preprotein translocase subunit YajC
MFDILSLVAQDSAGDSSGGGSFVFTLVFMGLIFGAMYFLMIRPQRRRMREQAELQRAMGEGDEVMTSSGIYGFISAIDGDVIWLEIAEGVEVRVARAAVTRIVHPTEEPAGGPVANEPADASDEGAATDDPK